MEHMVISDESPVVPRNRKSRNSVPNPSTEENQLGILFCETKREANSHNSVPNPSADEDTTRNSIPVNQNRSKISEFRSELFRGGEHNSEFLSVQQKIEKNSRNAVPIHSVEEKPTQNKTRQPNISKIVSEKTTFDVQTNHFVQLFCCCFVKLIFSAEFHSVPSYGIGSSAELGMLWNECFFPRNNRNRSKSIPQNFFGTKFHS